MFEVFKEQIIHQELKKFFEIILDKAFGVSALAIEN